MDQVVRKTFPHAQTNALKWRQNTIFLQKRLLLL